MLMRILLTRGARSYLRPHEVRAFRAYARCGQCDEGGVGAGFLLITITPSGAWASS